MLSGWEIKALQNTLHFFTFDWICFQSFKSLPAGVIIRFTVFPQWAQPNEFTEKTVNAIHHNKKDAKHFCWLNFDDMWLKQNNPIIKMH